MFSWFPSCAHEAALLSLGQDLVLLETAVALEGLVSLEQALASLYALH